jgi:YHS domain-containing protein
MRFLALILLVYLGYWLLRKWMRPGQSDGPSRGEDNLHAVDDVMVKDPFCETYFPKRQGVEAVVDGKAYHFCSPDCRAKFVEAAKSSKA